MRRHTKVLLTALTAAFVMASALSTASARNLSISNTAFRQVWNPLEFCVNSECSGVIIRCRVTLEGSFHYRTIAKVLRSLIGYVTRANVSRPCTGGEGFAETAGEGGRESLPWHITYEGFQGRLPEITAVRLLLRPRFRISTPITGMCQYEGNAQGVVNLTRGVATSITPDRTVGVARTSGGGFCPATGFFNASPEASTLTLLGNTTRITVTLI